VTGRRTDTTRKVKEEDQQGNSKSEEGGSGEPIIHQQDAVIDGGQLFLESLSAAAVDYFFYNPGSDYYPILEHLAPLESAESSHAPNRQKPAPLMCLSEHLALCMAHGYSMSTNRAQVVFVHVGIGTLQLGGALHNAHRGNAPVLICAGRAPFTLENEIEGGRESAYHWDQELFDQAGSVREYTKWQYELKSNANLQSVVNRALQVANAEPQGPVYLVLPRELLAEKLTLPLKKGPSSTSSRFHAPSPPEADLSTLQRMADLLLESENPLILTGQLGRNMSAVQSLVNLSESIAIGVVEPSRKRMNFPTDHPNYLPAFPKEALESADLIFLLDVDVPWIPSIHNIRRDAKIIQLDIDPSKSDYPLWGFPVDLSATGSSALALPRLVALVREKVRTATGESKMSLSGRIDERSARLRSKHDSIRAELTAAAEKSLRSNSLGMEAVLYLLNKVKSSDSIVVNEGVSYTKMIENYIDSTLPATFFGVGGSSLGEAMGNALGLKLSQQSRDVISLIGDGGFVYSNPTAVFWSAKRYVLPTLTIVINNGGYLAMKRSIGKFYPDGWSNKSKHYAGVSMDPQPDYVAIARACGAAGWKAEHPSEIEEAFSKALRVTRTERRPAVIEVVVS